MYISNMYKKRRADSRQTWQTCNFLVCAKSPFVVFGHFWVLLIATVLVVFIDDTAVFNNTIDCGCHDFFKASDRRTD